MGNWRRGDGRMGPRQAYFGWSWTCADPVLMAYRGAERIGPAVRAPECCWDPVDGAQVMATAAGSGIGHGEQEALWRGHEVSMTSGTG